MDTAGSCIYIHSRFESSLPCAIEHFRLNLSPTHHINSRYLLTELTLTVTGYVTDIAKLCCSLKSVKTQNAGSKIFTWEMSTQIVC
jgi:hypothetical protein